ncbi:hypothetical protein [Streptomyces sp. 1268]|uniref:hypothetical protein n=1 Tax=Streptomyces sp. 1268 TaxID=3231942 RepID=UPI0038D40902
MISQADAVLRAEPAVFGPVASDATVSRLIDTFATTGTRALTGCFAGADVRAHVEKRVGDTAPDAGGQVIVDVDGALVRSREAGSMGEVSARNVCRNNNGRVPCGMGTRLHPTGV